MAAPQEQLKSMIANMADKTGKPLDQWIALVTKSNLKKHGEIVKMLKAEHGVGHGFANVIAHKSLNAEPLDDADLVASQYSGPKTTLKPIYDAVINYVKKLGNDVVIAPKKTSVSIRRSKQFALVQAATKTRVDLGINFKGKAPTDRLEAWGGMITHRVRLTDPKNVDAEVKKWLKEAYKDA